VSAVPEVVSARQRHNVLVRHRGSSHPATVEARRDLKAATLADHIRRVVDEAPPLTAEQRQLLSSLLAPAAGGGSDAGT
jgi:hypothetical protein